jgi:hypothetical protein
VQSMLAYVLYFAQCTVLRLLFQADAYPLLLVHTWCALVLYKLSRRSTVDNVSIKDSNDNNTPKQSIPVSASIRQSNDSGPQQQLQSSSSCSTTTLDSNHDTDKPQDYRNIDGTIDGDAPSIVGQTVGLTVGHRERSFLQNFTQQPKQSLRRITNMVCTPFYAVLHTM